MAKVNKRRLGGLDVMTTSTVNLFANCHEYVAYCS